MHLIESMADVRAFNEWYTSHPINSESYLAFDTETTGLSPEHDHVRLVQVGDRDTGWAMAWDRWSGVFEDVVSDWSGMWVGHNAPFDVDFLRKGGIEMPIQRIRDTRIMSHIIDPTFSTALKRLTARYVDPRAGGAQRELDDALSKKGGWTWATIPITFQPYWSYAALDTALTAQLYDRMWPLVQEQAPLAFDVENSVQWITRAMERRGMHVDVEYAKTQLAKFTAYCEQVEKWCIDEYGIKPGANASVVAALQEAGFEFTKATASGAVALDADVLEGVDHPLARAVLQRRQVQKMASTYLTHYIAEVDVDDCIHPSINTLGARTSRMSMSGPNMQNLPRASEKKPAATVIRNCITARFAHTLLFCDFSQIEMRILAWLANDENMIAAFKNDGDFFVNLARQVFQDNTLVKADPRRDIIKTLGYAKIYGAGLEKMAKTVGLPTSYMREILMQFDETFPGVRRFQLETEALARRRKVEEGTAYATCPLTGRIHPAEPGKEYALTNYLIQGAAATLFKMKLIELDSAGVGRWMVAPVHDEIILDVPNEHVIDAVTALQHVMNDDKMFTVPIRAEVSYGQRWGKKLAWNEEEWFTGVHIIS